MLLIYCDNIDQYILSTELVTRYQKLGMPVKSHCRHIELFNYGEVINKPELYVSCPFYPNSSFEGDDYRLEYLVAGKDFEFSRKLVFRVPHHLNIGK